MSLPAHVPWPPHVLTLKEFDALPEDNSARVEVQDGVLSMSPRPGRPHARALRSLLRQLEDALPSGVEVLAEMDVLIDPGPLLTVRVPDLVITPTRGPSTRLMAGDVLVAIEIMSPGSAKIDRYVKPHEYAEAGIGHYWLVDLDPPVSLTAYHLAGTLGYQEAPAVSGRFVTTEPYPLDVDLSALRP